MSDAKSDPGERWAVFQIIATACLVAMCAGVLLLAVGAAFGLVQIEVMP